MLSFSTALHRAIINQNEQLFTTLLGRSDLDLECCNLQGYSPLWCALKLNESFTADCFASRLIKQGASADAVANDIGNH